MLVLSGLALRPASAVAGLNPAGQAQAALLAFSAPAAVAARTAYAAYYSVRYDNENGPYTTYDQAIQASQIMLWNSVHIWMAGESDLEQGLFIYSDKYGNFWFTTPHASVNQKVTLNTSEVQRPESTIVAMSHSHPQPPPGMMELFPQGPAGDNLTGWDQFVQRFGGDIWYYRPNTHEPKLYGGIEMMGDGPVLSTKYTGVDAAKLPQNVDLYGVDKMTGGDGSQVWWNRFTKGPVLLQIGIVVIGAGVFALIVVFSGGGDSGTLDGLPSPSPDSLSPGW